LIYAWMLAGPFLGQVLLELEFELIQTNSKWHKHQSVLRGEVGARAERGGCWPNASVLGAWMRWRGCEAGWVMD